MLIYFVLFGGRFTPMGLEQLIIIGSGVQGSLDFNTDKKESSSDRAVLILHQRPRKKEDQ